MKSKKNKFSAFIKKEHAEISEKNRKNIGKIVVKEVKPADMVEMVMDTDDATLELVADMGLELIKDDREELFAYAIKRAILDVVEEHKKK
jgi:fructose-1-phosphate kinase PfkB-like protein